MRSFISGRLESVALFVVAVRTAVQSAHHVLGCTSFTKERHVKIRHVAFAFAFGALMFADIASADGVLTSGTATRVGEPLEADSTVGRSQIKVCGKLFANPADLRTCTFHLAGDSPLEIVNDGTINNVLTPQRGGSATSVTFQTAGSARPFLSARFSDKNKGVVEFCISIDRAQTLAPVGISTEPCVDGDSATLETAFLLDCADGNNDFFQRNTWRVAANCNADFPNLRIIQ